MPSSHAFNSLLEFENAAQEKSGGAMISTLNDCFSTGKVLYIWEYGDLNNTEIDTIIGKDHPPKASNTSTEIFIYGAVRTAVYYTLITNPITGLFGLLALGADYLHMVDLCSNAFIVAPHEYMNVMNRGDTCTYTINNEGKKEYKFVSQQNSSPPLTFEDVPFFYHCDPTFDPVSGTNISEGSEDTGLIGNTWGYVGNASSFCAPNKKSLVETDLVGKAVVGSVSGAKRFVSGHTACESFKSNLTTLKAGESKSDASFNYYAYYRFDMRQGRVQLCVASPRTLLPIKIGCTTIPPPNEVGEIDPLIKAYMDNTTCGYFFTGRTDLHSLGAALPVNDDNGKEKQYVKDFLMSDLHLTSTVVNCIKDQLARMIVNPSLTLAGGNTKSYFETVQIRMRQIAFAALVLYVSIVGMMMITSPQAPKRGELLMWLMKFALVVYFIFIQSWYFIDNGRKEGLYSALIYGADSMANIFLNAETTRSPNDFCNYHFEGQNLIQERVVIPAAFGNEVENTNGYGYIKMSVWDLVDCKVANYLNYGTCQYSLSKMAGLWLFGAAFVSGGVGLLLSLVSFLYLFLLLLIIFKFTHTVVLASLVITVLIFVSPITIVCSLFKPTAAIFQQWMKALVGYFLYPALLFSFLALIMGTFSNIYYGKIDYSAGAQPIIQQCENINSIYCTIVKATGETDPCKTSLQSSITEDKTFLGFIKYKRIKSEYLSDILKGLGKSLLFVVIFYYYIGVLDEMISIVMGVHGLGRLAKGSINMINIGKSIGKTIASAVGSVMGGGKK